MCNIIAIARSYCCLLELSLRLDIKTIKYNNVYNIKKKGCKPLVYKFSK